MCPDFTVLKFGVWRSCIQHWEGGYSLVEEEMLPGNQKKKQGKSSANSPCNAAAGREVQRVKRFKLRFPGWDNLEAVLVREQSAFAI